MKQKTQIKIVILMCSYFLFRGLASLIFNV